MLNMGPDPIICLLLINISAQVHTCTFTQITSVCLTFDGYQTLVTRINVNKYSKWIHVIGGVLVLIFIIKKCWFSWLISETLIGLVTWLCWLLAAVSLYMKQIKSTRFLNGVWCAVSEQQASGRLAAVNFWIWSSSSQYELIINKIY